MSGRLLFAHAHPDDEASKGAATAAKYARAGHDVVLVTCTGGEAGEVLNDKHPPVDPADLPAVRAKELRASVDAIGFTSTHLLGYRDSGYHLDPADVPDGTFARAPLDEVAADLATVLREERPHVVVTYAEDGGYPHPDHIRVHEATMRALALAADDDVDLGLPSWRVAKVYCDELFTRERVQALHAGVVESGLESPFDERWMARLEERWSARDGARPTAWIEVGDFLEARDAALRAHATQVDPDGFWFAVPRDIERRVFPYECFRRLSTPLGDAPTPTDEPETDLLAGLDL